MAREYTARITDKSGRLILAVGPFENREDAINAAFAARPTAKIVSSGYGYGGTFDIQWTNRANWKAPNGAYFIPSI
jgi:hypothetical protein